MEIIINDFLELREFCSDPKISYKQAVKTIEAFCDFIVIDQPNTTKGELLEHLENYRVKFGEENLDFEKPIFLIIEQSEG
jgi:hypothetical protein